jgi:hypothetical protein
MWQSLLTSALWSLGASESCAWKSPKGKYPKSDVAAKYHIVDVSWKEG